MTLRFVCRVCDPPCRLMEESAEQHEAPVVCPYDGEKDAEWRFDK
jgi:hypothetical protein